VVDWAKLRLKYMEIQSATAVHDKLAAFGLAVPLLQALGRTNKKLSSSLSGMEDGSSLRGAAASLRDSMQAYIAEAQNLLLDAFTSMANSTKEGMIQVEPVVTEMLALLDIPPTDDDSVPKATQELVNKKFGLKVVKSYLAGWKFLFKSWIPSSTTMISDIGYSCNLFYMGVNLLFSFCFVFILFSFVSFVAFIS